MNNRLTQYLAEERGGQAAVPQAGGSFVLCPVGLVVPWQQQLYQAAYEKARAEVAARPVVRRLSLECWN